MTRVTVFIDYQNVYKSARAAFGDGTETFRFGQIHPRRAGVLLTDRGRTQDASRALEAVRVYRGEPSAKHSPKGQAACHRQVAHWEAQARVVAVTRPLKYYRTGSDPRGNDVFEAREKGIDVRIAIDMVMLAMHEEYYVCVLFSGDTDLLPALEAVRQLGKRVEVTSWASPHSYSSRLSLPGMWCHWLDVDDFRRLSDPTDYTDALLRPPASGP